MRKRKRRHSILASRNSGKGDGMTKEKRKEIQNEIIIKPQPGRNAVKYQWVFNWETETTHADFCDKDGNTVSKCYPPIDLTSDGVDVYCERLDDGKWYWMFEFEDNQI